MKTELARNETPSIDMAAIEAELRPLPTEELRTVFAACFGGAAAFIAKAAVCVKLMKERGVPLTGLPQAGTLLRIADGQTIPELVWSFAESPGRVDVLRAPLDDQKKLAANPMYPVVEDAPGGGTTTRIVDMTKAPRETVRQVLGPEGLRTPEEQVVYRKTEKHRPAPVASATHTKPIAEPLTHSITVKLTATESKWLTINAANRMVKPAELARYGLVQSGVVKEGKA